jgi:AAA domain
MMAEDSLRALGFFFEPGDVIEIRALRVDSKAENTWGGYFNIENSEAIKKELSRVNGHAEGIYFVLNRLNPALLARSANRLKQKTKLTSDPDILEWRWLYLDADPVRPSGISSTDAEHEAALARAQQIRAYLAACGWPEPYMSDSGNGGHLFYRLPELSLEHGDHLVKACLEALSKRFDDAAVKIDLTVFNRSRIAKLVGTMARKGDSTTDRPHRQARCLGEPVDGVRAVSLECLEALAAEAAPKEEPLSEFKERSGFDIDHWLAGSGLNVKEGPVSYQGGRKWILRCCPFNPEHTNAPAIFQRANGALAFRCFHLSCAQNDWKALRGLFFDGAQNSRQKPKQPPSKVDINNIPTVRSFDSHGVAFIIKDLIGAGCVNMLSGESGHGKSTLATAMAAAIAKGEDFAGRPCSKRAVLILDRENGIDVMQERYARLGITDESGLIVWGGWLEEDAPDPGSPVIFDWVSKTEPKPVVVIDTLVAFLARDENNASEVREFMAGLRRIANAGAAVIALHHTGKAETAKDYRGSSDFKGSIDIGIHVHNFGETELTKLRLKAFKSRFAMDREIVLDYSHGRFTSDNRPNAAIRTITEQLTELLRQHPNIKKSEFEALAGARGLGRNRGRTFLDDGVNLGEIEINTGSKNAKYYRLISGDLCHE